MTPADRARVVSVLRDAARIVAESKFGWKVSKDGCCSAIWPEGKRLPYPIKTENARLSAEVEFSLAYKSLNSPMFYWPRDEEHRPVRVIALLLLAAAVEAGDWP